jgi:hypothetical protein
MRPLRTCAVLLAVLGLAGTACRPAPGRPSAPPAPAASASDSGGVPATGAPRASASALPAGTLLDVRAARHSDYDRLVFEFAGRQAPSTHIDGYLDRVTEDPSDRPVALAGSAFLRVVFDGARFGAGARRLAPGYPLLRDTVLAGDFEAVLSWGVGLSRPAGVTVTTLAEPARVAVDFWYAPPHQVLWPEHSVDEARASQRAFDQGHQPWRGDADAVVRLYAQQVLGWPEPRLLRLGTDVYVVRGGTGSAIVTVIKPVPAAANGIWSIAAVAR